MHRTTKAAGAFASMVALSLVSLATPVSASGGTPSLPAPTYQLDWEDPADWTLPARPPSGWSYEYRPEVRHVDGEPQVRVADVARGEPARAGAHSVRFELDRS